MGLFIKIVIFFSILTYGIFYATSETVWDAGIKSYETENN